MIHPLSSARLHINSGKLELEEILEIKWPNTSVLQMRKQRPRGTDDLPKTDNQCGAAQDLKAGLHAHRFAPVITTLFFWVWVFLAVKSEPQVNNVLGQSVILTHTVWDQIAQYKGFPSASVVKNPPADAGDARDVCSIPGSGRPPGEGNGNPLQYSCLGNPVNRGAWLCYSPWGHKKSQKQLSD